MGAPTRNTLPGAPRGSGPSAGGGEVSGRTSWSPSCLRPRHSPWRAASASWREPSLEGAAASRRPSLCPTSRYFLQPRDNGSKSLKPGDLGSLRLNVVYTEDHVFSSSYYRPLRDLLLRSADVEVRECAGPCCVLGRLQPPQ